MLSIFHTQSTTIFKINTLPGNDAAQGSSYSGTGTGQNGILLNRLPQKLGKEDPDTLKKYTSVLYDQSLLAQGLSIDDPKEYAKSITELMMK